MPRRKPRSAVTTGGESLPPAAVQGRTAATAGSQAIGRRDVPALIVGADHRIRAANQPCLALFDGEPLLGRRCHEVFHHRKTPCEGLIPRCPLKHFRESGQPCRVVHVHQTRSGAEHHEISILPSTGADLCACLELRPVEIASAEPSSCRLVGRSPAFNRMLELLLRAAMRDTPVLLLGEAGTYREKVARRLHQLDGKAEETFLVVHCSGLHATGFAAELDGLTSRPSVPRSHRPLPDRGTLYLDDVGELGLAEQGELLRALKATDRRSWSSESYASSLRLACAARPDLGAKVAKGGFLEDLYYRISVFPITLPPLRVRREDLPLLVECLLRQIGCAPGTELHPRTLETLERYRFPGNLRELRRILEHASLQAFGRQILPEHLPPECRRQK